MIPRLGAFAGAAVCCALLISCGQEPADRPTGAVARAALGQEGLGSATFYRPYERLRDFLPNVRFVGPNPDEEPFQPTDSVVVGRVTRVERGPGYADSGQAPQRGAPGFDRVSHGSPRVAWRDVLITVDVDEVLAGERNNTITVSLGVGGTVERGVKAEDLGRDLRDLGRVVIFSKAQPPGEEYLGRERLLPDRELGVATIDAEGKLSFPFAEGAWARDFVSDVSTLGALREACREPERTQRSPET